MPDQPETEQPAKPKRTGRPSKASPQIFAKVLEGISLGLTIEQACALAGTSHDSFERWEKANPTLRAEAQARRIFLLIEKLQQDPKDWKRYAWMLERIFPKQYGVPPPGPAAIIANQVAQVTNPEDIKCIEGVKRELERVGLLYDPSKQEAE